MALSLHQPPPPTPRLSRKVLVVVAGLVVVLIAGVVHLQARLGEAPPAVVVEEVAPPARALPEALRKRATNYAEMEAQRQAAQGQAKPQEAQYVTRGTVAPVATQSLLPSSPAFPAPGAPAQAVPPGAAPTTATPAKEGAASKPEKKRWGFAVEAKRETTPVADAKREDAAKEGPAQALIHPATWAIPAYPLVTIYRSQTLIGRLVQNVNSDIPGQVKIALSMPLFDKFGYDHLILDKGTLIIASQDGKPQYGAMRLPLKLEQVELLTGEVVAFKASVGDQDGANGVAGKVNNHYGKLLLATGLSAILNIGVRTATGTPTGFYQNPAQQAAQDIGQDVQSSAKEVIGRELKVAPTIEIPAGTNVTINLAENITFSRKPVVIR